MKKSRNILCDFDGTIIEEDLERSFIRYLLHQKKIRLKLFVVALFTFPINVVLNKMGYGSKLKSWTYVLGNNATGYVSAFLDDFQFTIKQSTQEIINNLKADTVTILSACDEILLNAFLDRYEVVKFDELIGARANGLIVIRHPYAKEKCQYVDRQYYNIGIANDCSDRYYLEMCDERFYV